MCRFIIRVKITSDTVRLILVFIRGGVPLILYYLLIMTGRKYLQQKVEALCWSSILYILETLKCLLYHAF